MIPINQVEGALLPSPADHPLSYCPPMVVIPDGDTLAAAHSDIPASSQPERISYADVLKLVSKTIAQNDRRKLNLIITGLPESIGNPSSKTDETMFAELSNSELQYDLNRNIISTRRLGKADGSKPRRLLISFSSGQIAADIYSRTRELRHSNDTYIANNVYINLNLTREQSK